MKGKFLLIVLFGIFLGIFLISFASTWGDNGSLNQNIDGCNELNTSNATYTLTQNVTSTGTCFNITSQNITLDCNGYWINYSTAGGASTYGVYTDQFNTTIKNCNIVDGNWTSVETDRNGIYSYDLLADNIIIFNNFLNTNNSAAINLGWGTDRANLTSNNIHSESYYAVLLNAANNCSLINNTITSSTTQDIYCSIEFNGASNDNLIKNNVITAETCAIGITANSSRNNFIFNNISGGLYSVYSAESSDTLIRDCIQFNSDIYQNHGLTKNITLLNCSFVTEEINDAESFIIRKWYYQAYVNYSNGSAASNVNISAYNTTGVLQFTAQTNATGWIERQEVTEYNNTGGTRSFYNNYTLFANLSGTGNDSNIFNFTLTQNKIDDVFTLTQSADSNPPNYNSVSVNNTLAGQIANFVINLTDDIALHSNGQYIFSTNNTGSWVNDSSFGNGYWQENFYINSSLSDIGDTSAPSVFYKDSSWYLVSGEIIGGFYGFAWNGTNWLTNTTITNGLPIIDTATTPSVFYKDSSWYLISGAANGNFYGFVLAANGTTWLSNTTITNGLPLFEWIYSAPSVFYKDSSWYLISGEDAGIFHGFVLAANGTTWLSNTTITNGLPDIGISSAPSIFYKDSSWYLISGEYLGNFYGFALAANQTTWIANSTIILGLPNMFTFDWSFLTPSIFYKDSSLYLLTGSALGNFYGYNFAPSYNFTSTPFLVNTTKILNSMAGTVVGYKWYFKDNAGNINSTDIYILTTTEVDTTPPYFITIPANSSLFYTNESLSVDFDATDAIGFDYYSINDTRFSINQTGFLSNITPMAVGNYEINVSINDTSNNLNWTIYKVQINQSQDICGVYFNTTSPINYPATFIIYTNCSSAYTLRLNETTISNNSIINSGATAYNISVQRIDTVNYTNTFNQEQFIINKNTEKCRVLFNTTSPLIYPVTFLVSSNCTSAFVLKRNGTTITNNSEQSLVVGGYNFSFTRNDTVNYTNNYNETQFVINQDSISPYYNSVSSSSTFVNELSKFSIIVSDISALNPNGRYIFSTNNTGVWVNDSAINFTITPSWANVTKTLSSTVGRVIGYRWYFSDNIGNTNSTEIYKLKTTEVPEEDEEDDSSGGGGGGGDDGPPTFKPTYNQIKQGYELFLREEYKIQINLSHKGIYRFQINDINRNTGNVSFSINYTNYFIMLNNSIKINLNKDSYYDLEISLIQITFTDNARLLFKEINEEISPNLRENFLENVSNGNITKIENGEDSFGKYNNALFSILVGFVIFLIFIVLFFIVRRTIWLRKNS